MLSFPTHAQLNADCKTNITTRMTSKSVGKCAVEYSYVEFASGFRVADSGGGLLFRGHGRRGSPMR
jgi:hypothetical protein